MLFFIFNDWFCDNLFVFFLSLILVLLRCEQSHGERCTESFMRENVMEEETKRKMLDILKRFHSEEQEGMDDSMDDDDLEDGNNFLFI